MVHSARPADVDSHAGQAREIAQLANSQLGRDEINCQFHDYDLYAVDSTLSDVDRALTARLSSASAQCGHTATLEMSTLLLRSKQLQLSVKGEILASQDREIGAARTAVSKLRGAHSLTTLVEHIPVEAYQMGYTRVMFSRLQAGTWFTCSAFAGDDEELATAMVAAGLSNPRRLTHTMPECEMLRRGTPIIVPDARNDPRVYPELNEATRSVGYVAAPVYGWGQAIGLVHADRHTDGKLGVRDFDRALLGTFAEGLGIAFERNTLLERLQSMRQAAVDYLTTADSLADDFTVDVISNAAVGAPAAAELLLGEDREVGRTSWTGAESLSELTSREREVMHALVAGRTNAQIAANLFVTEGTVKSHVKRILRKLGAKNRTEAVTIFHRMRDSVRH